MQGEEEGINQVGIDLMSWLNKEQDSASPVMYLSVF
jgi:hypothetical protein